LRPSVTRAPSPVSPNLTEGAFPFLDS
jgi:hypothetical protein